jgi:acyl-CoA reductase-like NAD-dependent aldehyde dehydrogenase
VTRAVLTRRRLFIGGRWVQPHGDELIQVVNPATTALLATVPAGSAPDVAAAAAAAADALPGWSGTSVAARVDVLRQLAAALLMRSEELAQLITSEVGSPIGFSRSQQVGLPIQVIEAMATVLPDIDWVEQVGTAQVVREPVGVVGAITPWNYPLHQVVAKVAAALAAGCPVVLKPSEVAPLSAFVLAEILDEIGLPDGVFNLVTGYGPTVGEAIAGNARIDMVSLTGSGHAGRRVMELAAPTAKRVALELGGKSATVVLDDADLDDVVPAAVAHAFRNSGQNCSALSRLIVPRDRLAEVEAIAVRVAESVVVGDPTDPATGMGPLVSAQQRDRVLGMIRAAIAAGMPLLVGGPDPMDELAPGFFVRPTVFSPVDPGADIAQDEVFGPVLCILAADDEDDAVRIANSTPYGLSGAVWSADVQRARSVALRMRTGRVVVNGGAFSAFAPFGGYGQSGTGSELGRYGIEEFLSRKTLQL